VTAITEVVAGKEVKKEGLNYLERMFKNKQVHDALIKLLKGGVKDERFVTDSKEFGIDWITHTVTSNNVKTELKELVSETFT
jgi:hypothetical protein